MNPPKRWVMKEHGYGRSPVVCVDESGLYWTAWISWVPEGECVRVSWKEPGGEWADPAPCCNVATKVTGLAIAPWEDGILVAWIDEGHPDDDGLKLKMFDPGGGGATRLVVPSRRGPAHPSLDTLGSRYALTWTTRTVGGRQLAACLGTDPRETGKEIDISQRGGFHMRPSVVVSKTATAGAVFVWEGMSAEATRILARRADMEGNLSGVVEICRHRKGICAQSTLCRAADEGVWIAWQSDMDPEVGPGLVRWIDIAYLGDDGLVRRPVAEMPEVNRQGEGEDQGFEAPSIAVLRDGRLVVVGRGSQSVRRQELGTKGWSKRIQIDEEGWQCRGRLFSVCAADEGFVIVGRERDGIVVRWLPAEDTVEGAPDLVSHELSQSVVPPPSREPDHRYIIAGQRVLFGDIHQHTIASDGTGTIEEAMHRARYRYKDDIIAISDHESFLGKRTAPGEWEETCRVVDELYEPGLFVTLHAFEWTGRMHPGPGHKVVYLSPDGGPVLSREDNATREARGLIAESRKAGALVVPHHVGWTGANLDDHDQDVQPCWEIVSCHGAYERPDAGPIGTRGDDKLGQFAAEALDHGLRFGLVGGSDGHGLNWHHGVCRVQDSHRAGLTGVFSKEVSREGVLAALKRRCCYATSGAKIGLWFEIDGRPMGEELIIGWPVPFRVVVAATNEIKSLSLVSNEGREIPLDSTGLEVDVRGTLPPPPDGSWCYYFVRVVQDDGEVAWSSPIWLDAPDTA